MTERDPPEGPVTSSIVTDRRYHRYRQWKISRERTTVQGIASAIAFLRTGKFETIEQLADAMKLTVSQVRWRVREGRDRGLISESFYTSFAERK
ncbi:hypothetical protein [Rhizobium johnstonii]|uniref:hypothetical protein n=1 Tax=Rhizobium johnstonii TaxID=3019933 RepID=UPI003F9CF502